jgi:hypothetical protein
LTILTADGSSASKTSLPEWPRRIRCRRVVHHPGAACVCHARRDEARKHFRGEDWSIAEGACTRTRVMRPAGTGTLTIPIPVPDASVQYSTGGCRHGGCIINLPVVSRSSHWIASTAPASDSVVGSLS